jgi:hypothetical protein
MLPAVWVTVLPSIATKIGRIPPVFRHHGSVSSDVFATLVKKHSKLFEMGVEGRPVAVLLGVGMTPTAGSRPFISNAAYSP